MKYSSHLVNRGLAATVTDAMQSARIVAILGPRQAGKSTLAQMVTDGHMQADSLTLDDEPVRLAAQSDPQGFVAGMGRTTVIDEIQRAPELLLAIKSRVDRDHSPGQFLITGSANLRSIPTIADALPGRVDYLTLWPFTQGEIEGRPETLLERLFAGEVPQLSNAPVGKHEYANRLTAGGFPEAQRRSGAARSRFFSSYVASIVDRDVMSAARVHDPAAVATLLRLVAARSGSLARYETLSRDAGVDGKTVKSYLDVLERLFLIRIRQPWHENLGKRQVKAPKIYLSDTGMLSGLLGIDVQRLAVDGGLAGSLMETFVANELEHQASWARDAPTFWHYRDGDREVDTVIEHPSGAIVGVEVKASATVRPKDFSGLRHFRDNLGSRMKAGIVVYAGQRTLPFGEGLWALPLSGLWGGLEPGRLSI